MEVYQKVGGTLRRVLTYFAKEKVLVAWMLAVVVLGTLCGIYAPSLQSKAIDIIAGSDGGILSFTLILMLSVYLIYSASQFLQGLLSARISQRIVRRMREELFGKMMGLPIRYLGTDSHGDLMSRMTNDVENISQVVSQSLGTLYSGALTIVGAIAIMLYHSPALTCLSFVTVLLSTISTAKMSKYMRKYFSRQSSLLGELNGFAEEMITGYHTVVAYSREERAQQEFDRISGELRKTGIMAQLLGGIMGPLMNVIGNIGFLLIAAFGGYFALQGWISIGVIQAFIL